MGYSVTASVPRPRLLHHRGSFNPVRIQSLHGRAARHIRLVLQPGLSLFEALVRPLAGAGISSASTTILGGYFDSLQYCVAPPDPSGQAMIAYSAPIDAGAACMIFGNATLGRVEGLLGTACGDDARDVGLGIEGETDGHHMRGTVGTQRGEHRQVAFGEELERVVGQPRGVRHRRPR